ncbi:AraC family transcriptional regulator [Zunongwangia pacifica]|uniref:AraC family transcriptional regulator n=1 Tax=Zunongwangia pacifica TaxID=2911062 RepID=A0A9X1ZTU6_9FLAO|nr:AraC family transcriptional regulator [Zunongwangia pacifica]MCL6220927.1 AraC family transcriptional regulator [Zunongwangia pacifica]
MILRIPKNAQRATTPLEPEDSFFISETITNHLDLPVHFHPEYELSFIENGKGLKRIIGDCLEETGNLSLALIGPNLAHGWETYKCNHTGIHEISLHFQNDLFGDHFLGLRVMSPIKGMLEQSNRGIAFSGTTAQQLSPKIKNLSKATGIRYILELIAILHELATSKNKRLLSNPQNLKNSKENKLALVTHYLKHHYNRKIKLAEISSFMNMSPVSFNRFIKKKTGNTFTEYTNHLRVDFAAKELIEKEMSIAEIAFSCGFNNIAHFNRVFKKYKHCTPSQYRKEFNSLKLVG